MALYILTIHHCGKICEGSNEGVYWMLQQSQSIKDMSASMICSQGERVPEYG